jgi:hypothetical protein
VPELTQIEKFFIQYGKFVAHSRTRKLREFKSDFRHLKSSLEVMYGMKRKLDQQIAPNFNVFSVLGVGHLEVTTHSRFLAELFNPEGSHAQGLLFLNSFLRLGIIGFDPDLIMQGKWKVETEKFTAQGNLDIVISNYHSKHLVVVENKIHAPDQYGQLERYNEWIQNHSYYDIPDRKRLLYLTLSGIKSRDLEKRGKTEVSYVQISYKMDIAKWLEETVQKVKAPVVRHVLDQYVSLITRL